MADASIESLASGAIAAGCLQAVMSMVHPELVRFVAFQKERVARSDAEQERNNTSRHVRRRRPEPDADAEGLSPEQQTDLSFQLKYLRRHWHSHLRSFGLDPELPAVVQRALLYRNKVRTRASSRWRSTRTPSPRSRSWRTSSSATRSSASRLRSS